VKELDPEEYSSREAPTSQNSSNTPLSNSLSLSLNKTNYKKKYLF
jgi:hypothetical protein